MVKREKILPDKERQEKPDEQCSEPARAIEKMIERSRSRAEAFERLARALREEQRKDHSK